MCVCEYVRVCACEGKRKHGTMYYKSLHEVFHIHICVYIMASLRIERRAFR